MSRGGLASADDTEVVPPGVTRFPFGGTRAVECHKQPVYFKCLGIFSALIDEPDDHGSLGLGFEVNRFVQV